MEIVKIIGIIALIISLVAYLGTKCTKIISWFVLSKEVMKKVEEILEFVFSTSLTIGAVCGIVHLFA